MACLERLYASVRFWGTAIRQKPLPSFRASSCLADSSFVTLATAGALDIGCGSLTAERRTLESIVTMEHPNGSGFMIRVTWTLSSSHLASTSRSDWAPTHGLP